MVKSCAAKTATSTVSASGWMCGELRARVLLGSLPLEARRGCGWGSKRVESALASWKPHRPLAIPPWRVESESPPHFDRNRDSDHIGGLPRCDAPIWRAVRRLFYAPKTVWGPRMLGARTQQLLPSLHSGPWCCCWCAGQRGFKRKLAAAQSHVGRARCSSDMLAQSVSLGY